MTEYSGVMLHPETKQTVKKLMENLPKAERVKSQDDLINWLIQKCPAAQRVLRNIERDSRAIEQ